MVDEEVGVSLLQDMVSMLIKADNEGHPYLSVMVSFARHFAEDMMGILPRKQRTVLSKYNVQLPQSEVCTIMNFVKVKKVKRSMKVVTWLDWEIRKYFKCFLSSFDVFLPS